MPPAPAWFGRWNVAATAAVTGQGVGQLSSVLRRPMPQCRHHVGHTMLQRSEVPVTVQQICTQCPLTTQFINKHHFQGYRFSILYSTVRKPQCPPTFSPYVFFVVLSRAGSD